MFDNQDQLPTFPLQQLGNTYRQFTEWVEPLVDDEQFTVTKQQAALFFEKDGVGEKLQAQLEKLKDEAEYNWLTPFWEDHYLKYRGSLPTGMHFNILVDRPHLPIVPTTAQLAGKASYLVAEYYHKMIDEEIEPMYLKGTPLDMGQFKHFFRSLRIPQLYRDQFYVAPLEKENNFIIFIYKNQYYKVPVTNADGQIYRSDKIATAIEAIMEDEGKHDLNIGLLTTAERDKAAQLYNDLKIDVQNEENLQLIADALIIILIDEESETSEDALRNLMLNGENKFYDKTIQLAITNRGRFGYSIEHTAVDGTTIFSVISYINEGFRSHIEENYVEEVPTFERLEWQVSVDIEERLLELQQLSKERKDAYNIQASKIQTFGTELIKSFELSPDAFFHIALQLAQYRTFGELKSVYEPVSIRHFREGRTECARATSMEKWRVVQAIERGEAAEVIYELLRTASDAHTARIQACRNGFGIERHLFGLEKVYEQYGEELGITERPAFFDDFGYKELRTDFISTSGMAYDNVHSRIFGPVTENGFGIAYILLAESISINFSAHAYDEEQATELMEQLITALKELRELVETVLGTSHVDDADF